MAKQLSDMTLSELWELFPIILAPHNEAWKTYYAEFETIIRNCIKDFKIKEINHIGSTAINGIWAKPIIDILVEIAPDESMENVAKALESKEFIIMSREKNRISLNHGYTINGFAEKVCHVHLRYAGDNDELYFRNYLNVYPQIAKEYEQLKLQLCEKYKHNRDAYTEAKTDFVKKWTAVAKKAAKEKPSQQNISTMDILSRLFELQDKQYAEFQAKLTPTIPADKFIGVRVPEVRKLAKELFKNPEHKQFMHNLPHQYYDENMLHGLLVSEIKDYKECIEETDRFLPFVDNWAVCDIMSPKVFKKHKTELIDKIREWAASDKTYTIRFGLEMLMSHYLDEDFKAEYLKIPAAVRSEEYYVNMMIAWFFATALAKQWDCTIVYLQNDFETRSIASLPTWVHNKTIQKACESYRISDEQKEYLRSLKIKI